jgi:hypothetical protein
MLTRESTCTALISGTKTQEQKTQNYNMPPSVVCPSLSLRNINSCLRMLSTSSTFHRGIYVYAKCLQNTKKANRHARNELKPKGSCLKIEKKEGARKIQTMQMK